MNHNTVANGAVVIIDDDDSLDSAYETGSAVSRSTQSSPTRKHFFRSPFLVCSIRFDINSNTKDHFMPVIRSVFVQLLYSHTECWSMGIDDANITFIRIPSYFAVCFYLQ